jgi:hypothetical protein
MTGKVVRQEYCADATGLAKVRFSLKVKFTNLAREPVILRRLAFPNAVFVGRTAKNVRAGKYEPGSRMSETLGMGNSDTWRTLDRRIDPGQSFDVSEDGIWIRVNRHDSVKYGVTPGMHCLQIVAEVELSGKSDDLAVQSLNLKSAPFPFTVDSKLNPKVCK